MNENYYAYQITVLSEAAEAVEFGLNELDALGTEINHLGVKPAETLTVVGYFGEPQREENLRNQLNEALRIYDFAPAAISKIESRKIGDVDWLYEWKKHWKPTVTEKFIIAPSWEKIEGTDKIVVRIEPNMAFGTGTHETTRLCLKSIEENYQSGMSFFDVGTGTGILAIAAAKTNTEFQISESKFQIPQSKFAGCDTDEDSIKIANENAAMNEVEGIDFFAGSISEETPAADFVCANIMPVVIIPILLLLLEKSKKFLVLSGILREQESLMVDELSKFGITDCAVEREGEWIALTVRR